MSDNRNATTSDRYSSRYNRGLLKLLVGAKDQDVDKFLNQYHNSTHYQERLESIKFLSGVPNSKKVPAAFFLEALQDPCSQITIYLLKTFDYREYDKSELFPSLRKLVEHGENIQVKTLALELLADFKCSECFDLFFNASLLKSNKLAAAGLKGIQLLDLEKAYSVAKFKAEASTGPLDIIIAQIFSEVGDPIDLIFFTRKFKEKSLFQKMDFATVFVSYLLKLVDLKTVKINLQFISDSISDYGNHDLTQSLILHFHQAIVGLNDDSEKASIAEFLNSIIDDLLEKAYRHPVQFTVIS